MWVKICGNTRLEDCLLAAELGADAVGFVFAPGKRTVTAGQVAAITAQLPASVEKVGVFTAGDVGGIAMTAEVAHLTGLQLHGAPDRLLLESLAKATPCKLIQVLHWHVDQPVQQQRDAFAAQVEQLNTWGLVSAVLVDSHTAAASGGTGTAFDWQAVAPLLLRAHSPVIAAGGLKPQTVAKAIAVLKPWGVDVSSGVERAPGVKDPDKMKVFLAAARSDANSPDR